MSAFTDRIKIYNANKATTVPVNPPEAEKVLEEKAAPEVAGQPEPATAVTGTAPQASEPSQPPSELTKGQKAAATRAANKAKSADGAQPSAVATTTPEPSASSVPSGSEVLGVAVTVDLMLAVATVQDALPEGCTLTIQGRWKS